MLTGVKDLLALFERRKYEGLVWEEHTFEGETHVSVIPATVSRALRSIYRR